MSDRVDTREVFLRYEVFIALGFHWSDVRKILGLPMFDLPGNYRLEFIL